jgi:hypothetical protein
MKAGPPDSWPYSGWETRPASTYRVTIWEPPERELDGIDPSSLGWGEMTFDLTDVGDIREAVEWAERRLAANEGPYSRSGSPVRDREYVLYVKVPQEDEVFIQVAGWDPTRTHHPDNLRRLKRHS